MPGKLRRRHGVSVGERVTGPDEKLMREVERLLDTKGDVQDWRRSLISGIAAWALDHPGQKVDSATVFPQHLRHALTVVRCAPPGGVPSTMRS